MNINNLLKYNKLPTQNKKSNKYRNIKVIIDGITFDSIKEANRYCELKLLQKIGKIKELDRQKTFLLLEKFNDERAIKYNADFYYFDNELNMYVVEEIKGLDKKTGKFRVTKDYILKRKMFKYKYRDIKFMEV